MFKSIQPNPITKHDTDPCSLPYTDPPSENRSFCCPSKISMKPWLVPTATWDAADEHAIAVGKPASTLSRAET